MEVTYILSFILARLVRQWGSGAHFLLILLVGW